MPPWARVHRFLARAALAVLLSAPASASSAPEQDREVAFANGFPVTSRARIYPLSEVKRGDKGVGYTVFAEDKITPFSVEILGILENMLGPGKDVLLARLSGPEIEFTGVISGMSGSPVYIDGRIVGAVSYRFGSFSKEPIAGITPIESMIQASESDRADRTAAAGHREGTASTARERRPFRVASVRGREGPPALALPTGAPPPAGPAGATPIETPFVMSGLEPSFAEALRARFQVAGFVAAPGPSGAAAREVAARGRDGLRILDRNVGSMAGRVRAAPIAPGAPLAAVLMRGDIVIAATGTVTFVDGPTVIAFGHPFLGYGTVSMPMATASILHTLATPAGSYKQGAPALEVGTIQHDRITAIAGRIGSPAPMIPATIQVTGFDPTRGEATTNTRVEIIDHETWLPTLLETAIGSSAAGRLAYEAGGTVDMKATVDVGDRTLELVDTYTAEAPARVAAFAGRDVANVVSLIAQNDFEKAQIRGIDVHLKLKREISQCTIEALIPDRAIVHAGESLGLTVQVRRHLRRPETLRMNVTVPADFRGDAEVFVGGGIESDLREGDAYGDRYPASLEELLGLLAERRPSRAIYAFVSAPRTGLRTGSEVLSSLPPSQRMELLGQAGRIYRNVNEALGPTSDVAHPDVIVGSARAQIHVVR